MLSQKLSDLVCQQEKFQEAITIAEKITSEKSQELQNVKAELANHKATNEVRIIGTCKPTVIVVTLHLYPVICCNYVLKLIS